MPSGRPPAGASDAPAGAAAAAAGERWQERAADRLAGVDPRLGQPALAGHFARQVVTAEVPPSLRQGHATGRRLLELASDAPAAAATPAGPAPAPAGSVGWGGELMERAPEHLENLAEQGRRWQRSRLRPSLTQNRPSLSLSRPTLALVPAGGLPATAAGRGSALPAARSLAWLAGHRERVQAQASRSCCIRWCRSVDRAGAGWRPSRKRHLQDVPDVPQRLRLVNDALMSP